LYRFKIASAVAVPRLIEGHGRLDHLIVLLLDRFQRISGGCHLNRPIRTMIESAGFRFDRLETAYMPGPKPMSFIYEGSARSG
jgi:hypothetical protein